MNKILMIIIVLVVVGGIGYGSYSYMNSNKSTSTSSSSDGSSDSDKVITAEELAEKNGKNGASCWVAVDGKVYDATDSKGWEDGVHTYSNGQTTCGNDESDSISGSPHGSEVLSEMPVVGALSN